MPPSVVVNVSGINDRMQARPRCPTTVCIPDRRAAMRSRRQPPPPAALILTLTPSLSFCHSLFLSLTLTRM